ncbi:uncharacterized protein DNG_00044 [Cephalotrichum gorgonifer]|uniref:Tyrosinase copper-binding domain-containing protein n=1 Tax=Cephalotrichum gorgonifer TaxID=2041049 RepID=A0AAE8MN78_9PEZI|nr:uncharacterized protein DNG_00044 [Cephalotrichum gorgonifer]
MILAKFALLLAGHLGCSRRAVRGRDMHHDIAATSLPTLSDEDKLSYIDAELCLMGKKATLRLNGTKNKFEELQAAHQIQAGIAAFLPFHRLLMHAHDNLIREECGYEGTQPCWDESREAGDFTTSDVFDPVLGFGGDGVGDTGCIVDGPFAEYTNSLGPGYWITDHCITRFMSNNASSSAAQEFLDVCYKKETFVDMIDGVVSSGDLIIYLHHTWLEKVFWNWQALDLPACLTEMGG